MDLQRTPLLHAALADHDPELLERSRQAGESWHTPDAFGQTPLHWAVRLDLHRLIRPLLEAGLTVEAKDRWGRTVWDYAQWHRPSDRVLVQLPSRPATVQYAAF